MPQCPICKSEAAQLDPAGDWHVFDCPEHETFRVVDTIFSLPAKMTASHEQWEAALMRTQTNARKAKKCWPSSDEGAPQGPQASVT
jgi:hypothetical protein